jgi:hypothetical protein
MFVLNGKPLALNRAFTTEDGRQFPANWLRLATPEERAAVGITEEPDTTPNYDQRFYWGPNLPKDHAQLVEQWIGTTKQTAGSLLAQYDWYVVRQAETGKAVPQEVLDYRSAVRVVSDNREVLINGTTDTDQLYAVITGDFNGLFPWPRGPFEPPVEEPTSGSDTLPIDFATTGAVITDTSLFGGSGEDTITFE